MAYKVSLNAHTLSDGAKPVVWYETTQHAREWIATEVGRRLFGYVLAHATDTATDDPGAAQEHRAVVRPDRQRRRLRLHVPAQEHAPVAQEPAPTTTATTSSRRPRRRRPNRNWAEKWRYDQEGASDVFDSDTYRGTSPQSEPEVSSLDALIGKLKPKFLLDYHSPRAADPLPRGLAGRDARAPTRRRRRRSRASTTTTRRSRTSIPTSPASSTRPTATSPATSTTATARWPTRSSSSRAPARASAAPSTDDNAFDPGGFVFQDLEAAVEEQFQRNLPFALDLARSAKNPGRPVSHLGNVAPDFEPQQVQGLLRRPADRRGQREPRPRPGRGPLARRRRRGASRADDRVQGRRALRPARRLLPQDARHGHRLQRRRQRRGVVHGRRHVVDAVHVHGREVHGPARARDGRRGLLGQHEHLRRRARAPARSTSSYYTQALQDAGISYDVYDVDAHAARRRIRSACSRTTRASSGTRPTTCTSASRRSPAAPATRS